jgi:hypothetical protein
VKDFAIYTLARIGLFVASYAVIAGVWMLVSGSTSVPILWPLLLAAVVSAVASFYLLRVPRERFAARGFEEVRAKEDRD